MLTNIDTRVGNWIRFYVIPPKRDLAVVSYHPARDDLECQCKNFYLTKNCEHITWLADEFVRNRSFEDIRQIIQDKTGVIYSTTAIDDIFLKCLKVFDFKMYESLQQKNRVERDLSRFKLERESAWGVDLSTQTDFIQLGWQGEVPGGPSDQWWRVEQINQNEFWVRQFPIARIENPWRIVKRISYDKWESECACSTEQDCIHIAAAKTALADWIRSGKSEAYKKTNEFTNSASSGNVTINVPFSFSVKGMEEAQVKVENWKYIGNGTWSTIPKVSISYPSKIEEDPSATSEEPEPPAKPKSRFSRMDL